MSDKYYRGLKNIINDTKHKLQLASMTLKINENKNSISGIKNDISEINNFSDKINDNSSSISDNLSKINDIKSLLPTSEIFKKTYSIKNQSFRFTKNIIYFKLLEIEIENNFKIDGKLEFDSDIYYKYNNLQKDHHRLQHEYQIYDDKNNLLYKKILNKTNTSDLDFDTNIMLIKDNFYVTFKNNYNKIKIILDLYRVYRHGTGNFNLELINESFVNITYLDKNDISLKIDTNKGNILSNLTKIDTNKGNISSNLEKINDIENNLIVFDNIYNETLTIGNFTSISNTIIFFYETINLNFTTNGIIKIDAKYNYFENYNLTHIYKFYNNKKIFKEIKLDNISNIVNDKFEIQAIDSTAIDIGIFYETNTGGNKEIKLVGDNTCQVSYFDNIPKTNKNKLDIASNLGKIKTNEGNISSNLGKIDTNKNDISTNLININTNEDNIAYNLNEINYLKNNNSKSYLKNVYNILFYDSKKQISFKDEIFYEKIFDINADINNFIEIKFKIDLQYDDISERNYVKNIYEILDENDNSLYIKSINNNEYSFFSNRVIIDEDIFINFTKNIKKIKFVIKFQKLLSSRVIYLYYTKNLNYRFILKHYGN